MRAIVKQRPEPISVSETVEKVLIGGDLAPLLPEERVAYYKATCLSLGLNPLTRPFDYVSYQGKLQLYARKDCTDQLRKIYGISVVSLTREILDGMVIYTALVQDRHGRQDSATGSVWIEGLRGLELANAYMKAETKAKRRATLSICGLGVLDESELDAVGEYGTLTGEGRIMRELPGSKQAAEAVAERKIKEYEERKKQAAAQSEGKPEPAQPEKQAKSQQGPKPLDANKVLEWEPRDESTFYLFGYSDEIRPYLNDELMAAFNTETGKWLLDRAGMGLVKAWCAQNGHVLKKSGIQTAATTPEKAPSAAQAASPAPQAEGAARIEKVEKGTSKNGEFRKVFWKGDWHSTWDKKLFPYLDKAVGKGAEFLTVKKGNYSNIVSAKWIGETEFDEEGQPVIQRGPSKQSLFDEREPGDDDDVKGLR